MAGAAFGNGKADARAAFKRATQHFNLGEYGEALEQFKEAYRSFEDPTLLFNIAQCNRMLGNKTEALRGYRVFLRELPDTPNRAEVEALIASLDQAIRDDQVATNRPPTGTIVPSDAAATPTGPPPSETRPPPPPPLAASSPPTARSRKPIYRRWWLWTAVGVVAVGVGVGLGVGLSSSTVSYPVAPTTGGTVRF